MYKLKDVAKRGTALLGAVGLLTGISTSMLPAFASADALNPLTERSLTLSSSSPGWSYLDGSGNSLYAPPHSGANGQKTGNTFSYRMSSFDATVKAITFQYCTTPAGNCKAPGDNVSGVGTGTITLASGSDQVVGDTTNFDGQILPGDTIGTAGHLYIVESVEDDENLTLTANSGFTETDVAFGFRRPDSASKTDLNVVTSSPDEITGADWTSISGSADRTPDPAGSQKNFVVLSAAYTSAPVEWDDYTYRGPDWDMTASNVETGTVAAATATGKKNMITIDSPTGVTLSPSDPGESGDYFKVIFFGTSANYITNPGSGAFFVRMNTYSSDSVLDDTTLIDGGVTVANVMNESISIQTKVLETMEFSVGTHDPNEYNDDTDTNFITNTGITVHGQCDRILNKDPMLDPGDYAAAPNNVLQLGDANAEYSLATNLAYEVSSYWRLSSNSSGGATVYYTGHTLTNTVNDQIIPLDDTAGANHFSHTGTEQFGLALDVDSADGTIPSDSYGSGAGSFAAYVTAENDPVVVHTPTLEPLVAETAYGDGDGVIANGSGAKFSFNANADTYAIPLATENTDVVNCVTAKMRYIANIAATTPAGIYTTKVNYVASPQY